MHQIITNNPLAKDVEKEIILVDGSFREVLTTVRDLIHKGHRLLTHPLPASSRMFLSPVRSVVISKETKDLDEFSATMISESIELYDKHLGNRYIDEEHRKDYEQIDLDLLHSALDEL
ncbi:MAG: GrdX family protein [Tissierellia bacterium]|nr:GrdX family protein [Tissierellia bacterium]